MRNMVWASAMLAAAVLATPGHSSVTVGIPLTAGGATTAESDSNGVGVLAQGLTLDPGSFTVAGLSWWGNSFLGSGDPTTFHITFYGSSGGGVPSTTPLTDSVTSSPLSFDVAGLVGTAATDGNGDPLLDADDFQVYRYDWTPGSVYTLDGGEIFVSIAGDFDQASDTFLWSTIGTGGSYYRRDAQIPGDWSEANPQVDPLGPLAVTLTVDPARGNPGPVPEPATWAMMVFGFGIAGVAIRKRSRQVAVAA